MIIKSFAAGAALLALAGPASAQNLFYDDFNSEAGGTTDLNVTSLENWTVNGYVDVIAPDNALGYDVDSTVIDLGGFLTGGFIKTKQTFSFNAGDVVRISWDMSGNQLNPSGEDVPYMQFYFTETNPEQFQELAYLDGGGFFDFIDFEPYDGTDRFRLYDFYFAYGYGLYGDYPWTEQYVEFVAFNPGSFQFELGTYSGGGYGPLIDYFSVDIGTAAVPEPASWALMIAGFGLVGGAMRRRATGTVAA